MTRTEERFLEALRAYFRQNNTDWESLSEDALTDVIRLSEEQHVFPMIFESVYCAPAVAASPLFPAMRKKAMLSAALAADKTHSFLSVYRLLTENGLTPLPVKGILCRSVYPSGHLRLSADEDLIIKEEEYDTAVRLLKESGMMPAGPESADSTDSGWIKGNCYIELHRSLFPKEGSLFCNMNGVFGDLFSSTAIYRVEEDAEIRSLSPEKHLLYLILHAFKHFIHSGFGIRQVCDIGLWADRYVEEIDWQDLWLACEKTRTLLFSKSLFLIARDLTGKPVFLPEEWETLHTDPAPMLDDLLSGGIFGTNDRSRLHSAPITLQAAERQSGNRSGILSSVFPAKSKLEPFYPELKSKPYLLPVVWGKRIILYTKETRTKTSDTTETLRIAKERAALFRLYGIVE